MWPPSVLSAIGPILFGSRDGTAKLQSHFEPYVKRCLRPQWVSEAQSLTSLIDFRDYAEDTWSGLLRSYGPPDGAAPPFERLLKAVKATPEASRRRDLVVAFLEEHALGLKATINANSVPKAFIGFAIDRELDVFFDTARDVGRFRPILKAPREAIEAVLTDMETRGPIGSNGLTLEDFQGFGRSLGLTTLWPVLALWVCHEKGEEDLFLHPPLPRVFGAPSCVRNALERNREPLAIAKKARKSLALKDAILAGPGHLAFVPAGSSTAFRVVEAARAGLVAPLPGTSEGRFVWCLKPSTLEAAIYQLEPTWRTILEFEVPQDETDGPINWIDCQRDSEGHLVLLWGHINPLTGALNTQNVAGIDEDTLSSGTTNTVFLQDLADLPDRRKVGLRVDWRDHGNLLSVHHSVHDDAPPGSDRHWTHSYEVVFADHLLMTLTTDARPIEGIFGSPHEMLLLSPLSSKQALQLWTLQCGDGQAEYKMAEASEAPKLPNKALWQSVCVA